MSDYGTCLHEAAHCVAVLRVEEHAKLELVTVVPDSIRKSAGRMRVVREYTGDPDEDSVRLARAIVTALAGHLAEGEAPVKWPPDFRDAQTELRESLGELILEARIDRPTYHKLCGIAMDLSRDPAFRLDTELLALALQERKTLSGEEVQALLYPTKGTPCLNAARTATAPGS